MGIIKSEQPTKLYHAHAYRNEILDASNVLSSVVGSSFGPHGRLVSFDPAGTVWPSYTKDGVTIAGQLVFEDKFQRHIADTIIQAANRQLTDCGDGTTLTIILACSILERAFSELETGEKRNDIKARYRALAKKIEAKILEQSKPATEDDVKNVISVSLNNDHTLRDVVIDAVKHTGDLGVIMPRFSRTGRTEVIFDQGYQWRSGIKLGLEFCMNVDGAFHGLNPHVFVVNDILVHEDDLTPVVGRILAHHASSMVGATPAQLTMKDIPALVVIAHNFEHRAVQYAKRMRDTGKMLIALIQPEGATGTEDRAYHMANIAAFTGAMICDGDANVGKKNITVDKLGTCSMIHADTQGTCFQGGNKETIDRRLVHLTAIKQQLGTTDPLQTQYIDRSIARLNALVATIHVGGNSESEIRERLDRVEDALKAAYSAREMGVVPGGGIAMLIADQKNSLCGTTAIDRIFDNSGMKTALLPDIIEAEGYDISKGIVNGKTMFDLGIIDPTKNIISALNNALSVALCIVDTEWFLIKE